MCLNLTLQIEPILFSLFWKLNVLVVITRSLNHIAFPPICGVRLFSFNYTWCHIGHSSIFYHPNNFNLHHSEKNWHSNGFFFTFHINLKYQQKVLCGVDCFSRQFRSSHFSQFSKYSNMGNKKTDEKHLIWFSCISCSVCCNTYVKSRNKVNWKIIDFYDTIIKYHLKI